MKSITTPIKNQSGQGVIEYILVLIVTVGIILGVVYQINDAFRVWASNYFGEYLTCLLETGELPSLGGTSSGICSQQFGEFSILEGKPLIGNGVEGSSNGGETEDQRKDKSSRSKSSSSSSSRGATRPGTTTSSTSGRSSRFRHSPDTDTNNNNIKIATKKNNSYTGSTDGINVSQLKQRNGKASYVSVRGISGALYGRSSTDEEDKKKTKITSLVKGKTTPNRRKLMKVETPKPKFTEVGKVDDFTIGSFFKYLIIAAIIIILILLLVLQGGEIRKSMNVE